MSDSFFPEFSPSQSVPHSTFPTMPLLGASEDEQRLFNEILEDWGKRRHHLELSEAYYLGAQVVKNLRIAIPKELEFINPILGWGAKAVDPYVDRLCAEGFRLHGETDVNDVLAEMFDLNGFAAEQRLAFTDALSMGVSYWMVGSPVESGDVPRITVESPLNMHVLWDSSGMNARAAMQEYWQDGRRHGTLLVPGKTTPLSQDDRGRWQVAGEPDEHGFDFVPVVRMANRPRTHERSGRSAISSALRYYIDNAARTMLGLEVSRELYSVPQKAILGATEADFQNADGTAKSAWDTYITRVLALERDDEGNLPELKQLQPYDPSVFTKLLDWLASAAAGEVLSPPQNMGLYTQGNPATAEAVQASDYERDKHTRALQPGFSEPLKRVAQYGMRFQNRGDLPREFRRLDVDWAPVTPPLPGLTSDAVTKEIAAGAIPPASDVTLKKLGYSAVDRQRLTQDRDEAQGAQVLQDIAARLTAAPAPRAEAPAPNPRDAFGGNRDRAAG